MNFRQLVNENLVLLDSEFNTKQEVLLALTRRLYAEQAISSAAEFYTAVCEREKISPTGLEGGIAIPHGKSPSVLEAKIAIARNSKPILEWESVSDNNQVNLIILIAIPPAEAGSTHIEILTKLATAILQDGFVDKVQHAASKHELLSEIYALDAKPQSVAKQDNLPMDAPVVIALTSCATGIAHTYLAAEALEQAGRELGIQVFTEKHGARGVDGLLTPAQISSAVGVIFANDVALKNTARFIGLPFIQTRVAAPLKSAKELLQRVLQQPDGVFELAASSTAEND